MARVVRYATPTHSVAWRDADVLAPLQEILRGSAPAFEMPDEQSPSGGGSRDAFYILLPLLIVLSTFLFLLLIFLVCVILLRRRRGIMLRDNDGPIDMSREDLVEGEGGFEGVESRWLETVPEVERRQYMRAKEYQLQYPPNSMPTDITLSQFLSIQEKGVSAWSFDPDFEAINSMLVHARTEITFLPDPSSATSVQSNLPLPKLNEVYYWEVKMFDLPETTNVAVGLATKPYPSFRLPGLCRYSVAYHSNGDKSHNYPFTTTPCGLPLKESDVLGVGYRPRTGTVFFTKNGRKMEDAFIGLNNWNLFPTVGADGPCSVHVNLGQSGFVFIEANVKKWGLAPSVGTLAPPPPYGNERGTVLLEAGGDVVRSGTITPQSPPPGSSRSRRSHRSRRPRSTLSTASPLGSSPARSPLASPTTPETPPPPITPIEEESESANAAPSSSRSAEARSSSAADGDGEWLTDSDLSRSHSPSRDATRAGANQFNLPRPQPFTSTHARTGSRSSYAGSELAIHVHPPPDSPMSPEPPTPDLLMAGSGSHSARSAQTPLLGVADREPPAYSPLDAYAYSEGVHIDLPAEVIAAALERGTIPSHMINAPTLSRSDRHRSRRERR